MVWLFAICSLFFSGHLRAEEPATEIVAPRVLKAGWRLELVLSEPDLVTPVSCCFDGDGRLYVIESHTHRRTDEYVGPDADRIYVLDDTDNDGVVDRKRTFFEGGHSTMGVVAMPDGWIAVVRRDEIVRLRDTDGDAAADQREVLVSLETETVYPHNGLVGGTVGGDGRFYFGLGENFGEPYAIVAADGSRQTGSGEGGGVFSITPAGNGVERMATGFWNPFAMQWDRLGRLWVVGNDPDAMPPCRLVNVVPTGDYGFQFRFGRSGTHALQSWNGELPATLPYTGATGEAPSGLAITGDQLWVTSWGDNRIECHKLPKGNRAVAASPSVDLAKESSATGSATRSATQNVESTKSAMEIVVQGGANFRPVGIALSPSGDLLVTDWVKRDYAVHGMGRLWRLVPPDAERERLAAEFGRQAPEDTESDRACESLQQAQELLRHHDPFVRQSAIAWLSTHPDSIDRLWSDKASKAEQVACLAALRWWELCEPAKVNQSQRHDWIKRAMQSSHSSTRLYAVRWAAERDDQSLVPMIRDLVDQDLKSLPLFSACVSAISYLQNGTTRSGTADPAHEGLLWQIATDDSAIDSVRVAAINGLPPESKEIADRQLERWLFGDFAERIKMEVVRLVGMRNTDNDRSLLNRLVVDTSIDRELRRDAAAFLKIDEPADLESGSKGQTQRDDPPKPPVDDLDAWSTLVGNGGDARRGYRVFVRQSCIACHEHSGRGASTGPSLSNLEGQSRQRLLQSILHPSAEIAPLYVPQKVLTVEGKVLVGIRTTSGGVGRKLRYQASDGMFFDVAVEDIEYQQQSTQSLMPSGLEKQMSIQDMKDLLALLETSDE